MEENNRKGPGIFYGVIGVATLIVAIIGATFAYFSASKSAAVPQGTTASAGGIDLTVTPVTDTNSNFIPLNLRLEDKEGVDTVDQFADAMDSTKGGVCKDSNGNNVCQVYRIVVKNKSTTSTVQVRGTLTLKSTAANIFWRLIDATVAEDTMSAGAKVDYSTDVKATASGAMGYLTVGGNSGKTGAGEASKTLGFTDSDNSQTYYVVIWLEEIGESQEGADAAMTFDGTVEFNAVDATGNTSGITASFVSAG